VRKFQRIWMIGSARSETFLNRSATSTAFSELLRI